MKRGTAKSSREIWSKDENSFLVKLADKKDKKPWNEIARTINAVYGANKTGKQCRERFRNYANPKLEKASLKQDEKLLFIILHKVHRNHWSNISKYLNCRSDIAIKNYFYRVIRKATKHLNTPAIPISFLKTPEKFYRLFSVLSYIREYYLPEVKNLSILPKYSHKERMILNLLLQRNITEKAITSYEEHMINQFKDKFGSSNLPIKVSLSLEQFKLSNEKAKELKSSAHLYNTNPLDKLVLLQLTDYKEEIKFVPSLLSHTSKFSKDSESTERTFKRSPYYLSLPNHPPLHGQFSVLCPVLQPVAHPFNSGIYPQTNFGQQYLFPQLVQIVYDSPLENDKVKKEELVEGLQVRGKEDKKRMDW